MNIHPIKTFSPWQLRHEQHGLHVIDYLNAQFNALYNSDDEEAAYAPVFRGYTDYIKGLRLPFGPAVY